MWYLAIGLAARGWESHNLEIWWNSDSFFVSFEVTLSGSRVPGYSIREQNQIRVTGGIACADVVAIIRGLFLVRRDKD